MEHGMMFNRGGDDVLGGAGGLRCDGCDEAENREIVRLGGAASEDDFGWLRAEERGYGITRAINGGAGALSSGMNRAGVAEIFGEERQHCFEDCWVHGSGRIVVEISAHVL